MCSRFWVSCGVFVVVFFFQAEDGIRDAQESRGLGDVYKRQVHGVTIVGPQNLPSRVAFHASQMYAKNLQSFLSLLVSADGVLTGEFTDEILASSLLVSAGKVQHKPTLELINGEGL